MTRLYLACLAILLLWISPRLLAAPQCSAVFPDAATSFDSDGEISFSAGSSRLVGGSAEINFNEIDRQGNSNCSGSRCESSNTTSTALTLSSFQTSGSSTDIDIGEESSRSLSQGDYKDIDVDEEGRLTFTGSDGVTRIEQLSLDEEARVTMTSGTYWIDDLSFDEKSELRIPSGNTVVLYVNSLSIGERAEINTSNDGNAGQLIVISYDDVDIEERAEINAFLYAQGDVSLDRRVSFTGSISTPKLDIGNNSDITYAPAEFDRLSSTGICDSGPVEPPEPEVCETYRDNFSSSSFGLNAGTLNWSGNWVEFDIDGSGTSNGDIRIVNNELRITGKDNRINNNSIARQFSGTGYTSATLTFDYDPSSGLESDDRMYVEISTNGGSSYTTLDILQGLNGNPSTLAYSRDISSFLSANMRIRFRVFEDNGSGGCCFGPDSEYIDFDNVQVQVCNVGTPELPDPILDYHFDECSLDSGVVDSAGSFDGTATNAESSNTELVINRSLDLSASGTSDYVTADSSAFNGLNDFTLSVWIKTGVSKSQQEIFQALGGSTGDDEIEIYLVNSNQVRMNVRDSGNTVSAGTTLTDDNWHHLAITRSGADMCLYVDGSLANCHDDGNSGQISISNASSVIIGQEQDAFGGSFNSGQAFEGFIDEFTLYDSVLDASLISQIYTNENNGDNADGTTRDVVCTAQPIAYYSIVHPALGLTCETSQVTVSACVDVNCALYDQPVSISVPRGDDTRQVLPPFIGQTTFNVDRDTAGTVTLDVAPLDTASVPVGPTQCSGDCTIEFREAAFVFVDRNNGLSTTLPDLFAESDLSSIGIRAVRDDQGACQAALQGNQTVNLGFDCISNPSYSTNTCQVPFAGVPVQGGGTGVSSADVTLTFDAQGVASLSGTYNDAGRLLLYASGSYTGFSLTSGPDGAQFDSIPSRLEVSEDADALHVAADTFDITLEAYGVIGSAPLPSFSAGQLQASYQRLVPSDSLASSLESTLSLGSDASYQSVTSTVFSNSASLPFTDGQYQTSLARNSEVGEYTLSFRDANYLGSRVSGNRVTLGRFIPAYFDVQTNTPRVDASCDNTFTYIGENSPFESGTEPLYTVTAYNAQNQITRLYSDAQWRLNPSNNDAETGLSVTDQSAFALPLNTDTSALSFDLADNTGFDGRGTFTLNNIEVGYVKPVEPDNALTPFDTEFSLALDEAIFTDSDGVCYRPDYTNPASPGSCSNVLIENIGDAEQRYGRLALLNTYGPETVQARVPMRAEYWDRGNWRVNTDDSCTAINFSQVQNEILVENASVSGESNISAQYLTLLSTGTLNDGVSALTDLVLLPPLSGARGSVRVSLNPAATTVTWPDYLNIDWDRDGDIDDDDIPSALVSFGLFRGNDRIFHSREVN